MRLSPDPAARRRLAALAAASAGALIVGVVVGAGAGDDGTDGGERTAEDRRTRAAEPRLGVAEQVGRLLVIRYVGAVPPAYVTRALRERRAAGVILFRDNAPSPEALRRATRRLQRAAGGAALVAADQEGGAIRTLAWAPPELAQPGQATAAQAEEQARAAASELRAAGVNVTLGPIADVAAGPASVVAGRAFTGDAEQAAELVRAAVRGYADGRVAATPKHFPGLGAATANTDDVRVTIDRSRADLDRDELVPFAAAVRAGAPLVMAGHALYPALDPRRIASQSPATLDGLLRERLGFRGAVITDSMEAEAVISRSSVAEAAVRAVAGGSDLLLLTGPGSYLDVRRRLEAEARRSPRFRARVADAGERVAALRRRLGLGATGR